MSNLKTGQFFNRRTLIAAAIAISMAPAAYAQRIVFDPTNFFSANVLNYSTLLKKLAEAQLHTGLFKTMLDNEFKFEDSEVRRSNDELALALRLMEQALMDIQHGYAASKNEEFGEYMARIGERAEKGDKAAKTLMDNAYEADAKIVKANEAYRLTMERSAKVPGITQAVQSTTNAVGIVIQQNQAMLGIMSSTAKDTALKRAEETAKKKHDEQALKNYIEKTDAAYSKMEKGGFK